MTEVKDLSLASRALQENLHVLTTDLKDKSVTLNSVKKSLTQKEDFIEEINDKFRNMQEKYSCELDTKNAQIDQHRKDILNLQESMVAMRKNSMTSFAR